MHGTDNETKCNSKILNKIEVWREKNSIEMIKSIYKIDIDFESKLLFSCVLRCILQKTNIECHILFTLKFKFVNVKIKEDWCPAYVICCAYAEAVWNALA